MSRRIGAVVASVLVALVFVAAALAATPIRNGVYDDGVHGVIVAFKDGNKTIKGLNVTCHGKVWVATKFITVKSGKFSYSGPDFVAKNGRKTNKTGSMTASGTFKSSRLVTGKARAGGCSTRYSATFASLS